MDRKTFRSVLFTLFAVPACVFAGSPYSLPDYTVSDLPKEYTLYLSQQDELDRALDIQDNKLRLAALKSMADTGNPTAVYFYSVQSGKKKDIRPDLIENIRLLARQSDPSDPEREQTDTLALEALADIYYNEKKQDKYEETLLMCAERRDIRAVRKAIALFRERKDYENQLKWLSREAELTGKADLPGAEEIKKALGEKEYRTLNEKTEKINYARPFLFGRYLPDYPTEKTKAGVYGRNMRTVNVRTGIYFENFRVPVKTSSDTKVTARIPKFIKPGSVKVRTETTAGFSQTEIMCLKPEKDAGVSISAVKMRPGFVKPGEEASVSVTLVNDAKAGPAFAVSVYASVYTGGAKLGLPGLINAGDIMPGEKKEAVLKIKTYEGLKGPVVLKIRAKEKTGTKIKSIKFRMITYDDMTPQGKVKEIEPTFSSDVKDIVDTMVGAITGE